MYYEERIIDGVLHWRGTPTGAFKPCTPERLTQLLAESRAALAVEAEAEKVEMVTYGVTITEGGWTGTYAEWKARHGIKPAATPAVREVVMALKLADQFFDGQDGVWEWDDGEPFPASRIRLALQHPSIKPLLEPSR